MLTVATVRSAARTARTRTAKSADAILTEAAEELGRHDIFLSHSFRDRELVLGTREVIMRMGLTVYVDWIDDSELDRDAVDRSSADRLRTRMQNCDTLFYAHTPSSMLSSWCPWELGYFDAFNHPDRQVFVLPVVEEGEDYAGQEYLSLYDVVDLDTYVHQPRRVREAQAFQRRMFRSAFGLRD